MARCIFPDHPVIAAMERDGELPLAPGYVFVCEACGCGIYPGERFFRIGDKTFCEDHRAEALAEVTEYA